jgi:dynamin-binding protein
MHYITRHPASLTHLNSLPQTPALAAYHATTRTLAQQLSHAWDLPSLLIKPVQRLLKYALLLHAIIEATPDSHTDKENLRRAKSMVEAVSHAINEGQRRREIVKEAFTAGKPAELLKKKGLGIVGRVRTGVATPRSISRSDSEETERVARMGRDMSLTDEFIQKFAKEAVDWAKSVRAIMRVLRIWAEGFGRVIGLGPDVTSEAYDAFLVVVDKQLTALCIDLEVLIHEQLLPQLRLLLDTIKRPALLLETLHALEPHHYAFLQHNPAKGRPPAALNEASIAYVALRAQLCTELPMYLTLLHSGVTLCVGQLAKWQARLWRDVRTRWSDLWDALRVEGEMNAGSDETERVWRARWDEAATDLQTLNIIHLEKSTPRLKQTRTSPPSPTSGRVGATNAVTGPLETVRSAPSDALSMADTVASARRKRSFTSSAAAHRLGRRPSTESLHSIRSARSSTGHGHYIEAPEPATSPPRHPMPRRQSMPMSLNRSSSQGKLAEKFGRDGRERGRDREEEQSAHGGATNGKQAITGTLLPSLPRRNVSPRHPRPSDPAHHHNHNQPPSPHAGQRHHPHGHGHPPMPPAPQLTVSSRWYRAPALYTCRVVHECDPPEGVEYYGLPFFKLFLDDVYHVLKEAGHPSRHRDLPLLVDEGEDCLLLARDESGELGWLLASFLYPVD